jgi:hypothetical protein
VKVGESLQHAIDDWEAGKAESAMLHACNAIDGTAAKAYPQLGNRARFTRLLRDNYSIFGPMALPGVDIEKTRFPVTVQRPTTDDGKPDIADVVYGVHRCTHAHGDELPDGFDLIPDAAGPGGISRIQITRGRLQLSDRVLFGLLAVAIMSPANVGQRAPDGYYLTFGRSAVLAINDWWGRAADFAAIAALEPMPIVKMDFGDRMDS